MKKVLPYIFMVTIIATLFAPFGFVTKNNNSIALQKNEALAASAGIKNFTISQISNTPDSITLQIDAIMNGAPSAINPNVTSWERGFSISIKDESGNEIKNIGWDTKRNDFKVTQTQNADGDDVFYGTYRLENLQQATKYKVSSFAFYNINFSVGSNEAVKFDAKPDPLIVQTFDPNNIGSGLDQNFQSQSGAGGDILPACSIMPGVSGTVLGCVVQVFYYVAFVPTSYIFGLAGKFFDKLFAYSITDSSYTTTFVTKGWGLVRDICNIFFIFILIYAAFGMILGISSIHAKSIIIDIIIVGLLINFSLFATRLMIDTSNILARVFYNSNAVKITLKQNADGTYSSATRGGVDLYDANSKGELPLSAALVAKVNPQDLIINSYKVKVGDDAQNQSSESNDKTTNLGVGGFFLVTFMATIINIIGVIVFFSVGIIFLARVIGLWFAMIFVPFAFLSITVPSLKKTPQIGWSQWVSETTGLCFVAPIFMFFLYLILLFLDQVFGDMVIQNATGADFVLKTIIPFAFIMIMLLMAKKMAKSFSGSIGETVAGGIQAAGALALGGAALTTGFIGRGIGQKMAQASRGETNSQKYLDPNKRSEMSFMQKTRGFIGSGFGTGVGLNKFYGKDEGKTDLKTGKALGVTTGIGGLLNKKQRLVDKVDHGRHELEDIKAKAGLKGVPDNKLSGRDEQKIKEVFLKTKRAEFEQEIRSGRAKDASGQVIMGEDEFKKANRADVETQYRIDNNIPSNATLTPQQLKAIETQLNIEVKAYVSDQAKNKLEHDYDHAKEAAKGIVTNDDGKKVRVKQTDNVISKANTGTWDVRNLSDSKADKRASTLTKLGVGAIASIALGVRTGLKGGLGMDPGKGTGKLLDDLKETIKSAMKEVKINVPSGGGGGHGGGHDDHGGGHDDHGGGHH